MGTEQELSSEATGISIAIGITNVDHIDPVEMEVAIEKLLREQFEDALIPDESHVRVDTIVDGESIEAAADRV